MLAIVSPAKKLDFEKAPQIDGTTQPALLKRADDLADILKDKSMQDIQSLMSLSDKLAQLNYDRYQAFTTPFTNDNAKAALYVFKGDTYVGLDAESLNADDVDYAQDHLFMLSGLYGALKPKDLMQPYRLEMGTKLANSEGEDLYDFWGNDVADLCNQATQGHKDRSVINLASNEYNKVVKPKALEGNFITCHFKEMKGGAPKVIGLFAKRARGSMARYIIQNRIETPEGLKGFNSDGYEYIEDASDEKNYVFIRDQEGL